MLLIAFFVCTIAMSAVEFVLARRMNRVLAKYADHQGAST